MHYAVICLAFLSLVFFISLITISMKYFKLKKTFHNHKKALRGIIKTINSVRYGNLFERVNKETFSILPNFSESINRLIETIVDREEMIEEYQKDLNKKIEALKEIEQLKEDFVATLTHDLKVPILAEKNMLNFLLDNRFGELNEKQKEALDHLKNSNKELVELVEIILETYKLNETQIDLHKESLDIKKLLENTITEMQPIADTDSIKLNFDYEYKGNAFVDEFYIKRVLKNLILNAISFSDNNTKVDINLTDDSSHIYIKITNYGKFIKKEEIDHVFDKYYTTTKKFRKVGTGLGLYLSNKIIKAHNGKIILESQEKKENDAFTKLIISLEK